MNGRSRTTYRPTVTPKGSTHVDTAFTDTTSSISRTVAGKVAVAAAARQRVPLRQIVTVPRRQVVVAPHTHTAPVASAARILARASAARPVRGRILEHSFHLVAIDVERDAVRAREVLRAGQAAPGHVFNLGHGVLPSTNPDMLARLTDLVHSESAR